MKGTTMFDVDGTITKEGENSPKAQSIPKLEGILYQALDFFVKADCMRLNDADRVWTTWNAEMRPFVMREAKYYGRFFNSEDEVLKADKPLKDVVVYEVIKDFSPEFSKNLSKLMIAGMVDGTIQVVPYDDAVESIVGLANDYRIATFSGGSVASQRVQLSRVPVNQQIKDRTYKNVAEIVEDETTGTGFHSKKEFGSKTKKESYIVAAEYFSGKGIPLKIWITDSIKEAELCKEAAEVKKFDCTSVYVNRLGTDQKKVEELIRNGIVVMDKLSYSKIKEAVEKTK